MSTPTPVDLRSDTVTRPTAAMRRVIADAPVGDDVFGEDPSVQALEERVAELLQKPAALFVPSGTMANQIGLALHAGRGEEVLIEADAHVLNYEGGAASALWGLTLRPLAGDRGRLTRAHLGELFRPDDPHFAPVRAVAVENTHNRAGGAVWPLDDWDAFTGGVRERGVAVHLDGARLWNASCALGVPESRWTGTVDTVSVCFSKGLGAPVGSALAGEADAIRRARRLRKQLGGGMRQAGVLAAAALHAIEHHRERLSEDHRRARRLTEALEGAPGITVLPVDTNIVLVQVDDGPPVAERVAALGERGVLVLDAGRSRMRMVTHMDVDDADIDRARDALSRVFGGSA